MGFVISRGLFYVLTLFVLALGVSAVQNLPTAPSEDGINTGGAGLSSVAGAVVDNAVPLPVLAGSSGVFSEDSSIDGGVSAVASAPAAAVPLMGTVRRQPVVSSRKAESESRQVPAFQESQRVRNIRENMRGRVQNKDKETRSSGNAFVEQVDARKGELRRDVRSKVMQIREPRGELSNNVRTGVNQEMTGREEFLNGVRNQVKQGGERDGGAIRKDFRAENGPLRGRLGAFRNEVRSELRVLKEQRQEAVVRARKAETELAVKVQGFRAKAFLNESERAELAQQARLHVKAAYDHRVELAKKMEVEGANASLVADFVAYAENNWNQSENASNNFASKELIVGFNHRWRDFKKSVAQDLLKSRLALSVNASRQILTRFEAVIAKLSAGGFNTTALVNASRAISARLDSVLLQPDVPSALARLRQAHNGLVHLRNAIQHTVNRELVEAYRELPAPSVVADESLSIEADSAYTSESSAGIPLADAVASSSVLPSVIEADVSASSLGNASASSG